MKKLTLTILVAMVPFLIMAQKNKRKNKNQPALPEMMVIKGVQMIFDAGYLTDETPDMAKEEFNYVNKQIQYSPIEVLGNQGSSIMKIEEALEIANSKGWEVYSANTVVLGSSLVYFYYMRR